MNNKRKPLKVSLNLEADTLDELYAKVESVLGRKFQPVSKPAPQYDLVVPNEVIFFPHTDGPLDWIKAYREANNNIAPTGLKESKDRFESLPWHHPDVLRMRSNGQNKESHILNRMEKPPS